MINIDNCAESWQIIRKIIDHYRSIFRGSQYIKCKKKILNEIELMNLLTYGGKCI